MNRLRLESLTELEAINPITRKEFCYDDGCPTDWIRGRLNEKDLKRDRVAYECNGCQGVKYYPLIRGKR